MLLPQFDPPAFLDDLNAEQKKEWGAFISARFDDDIHDYPETRYFNPTKVDVAPDVQDKSIGWAAFPRLIQIDAASDSERWQRADAARDVQDEYCEWSVSKNSAGKITRATFTCEGPEYWKFLAAYNPDRIVALYQQHIDPTVRREDLFRPDGTYEPRNRWNSTTHNGAMHLVQENNDLGAQINIAVRAAIVRVIAGRTLTQPQELIQCGRYGNPERHSDPQIGAEVNALARLNAAVTLANPVGLYIEGISPIGWETPDGSDPLDYWRITRGTADHALRAVYEVPPEKGFVVGDLRINGNPIQYGAQIVDFVRIKLTGLACRFGQIIISPATACHARGTPRVVMGAQPRSNGGAAPSVAEALRLRARGRTR